MSEPKRKIGRPAKPPEERAKVKIWTYLREAEKKELDEFLSDSEMTVSTLLRSLLKEKGAIGKKKKGYGGKDQEEDSGK